VLPFSTLQQGFAAGGTRLVLSPGTYGDLALGSGGFAVLVGDQITNTIGKVTSSDAGGGFLFGVDMNDDLQITDANGGFYGLFGCELGITGPIDIIGGTVGGSSVLQIENCDFGFPNNFSNWLAFLVDDYSERQMMAAGCTFTSTTSPIGLVCLGSQSNARILTDSNQSLPFGLRHVLPRSAMTVDRTYTLDMTGALLGEILTFDTYNNSGHSALVKLGGSTLYTAVSSATASRVRFKCTLAGTTAVLDSIEKLNSQTV
jgi:hypothetical protein